MTTLTGGRIAHAIPLLDVLRSYPPAWLSKDVLAALTVWALLVPQGLAYAQLAGLGPEFGLYAGIGALVGYALFGRVRELSSGPEATVALLSASALGILAGSDPERYIALAGGLALMVGVMLFLAGLAGLGFVTRYLSRPLLVGYVTGSAVVMIVSQLDSLIGVDLVAEDDTLAEFIEIVRRLSETDAITLAIGLLVIAVVVVVRRISRRIPAYLVAVMVAIVLSALLDLAGRGVSVVGTIPAGLPPVGIPDLRAGDLANLALPAVAIAFLVFSDSGVTGQVLMRRAGYRVDANGEFFGLAAANVGAALTGGFPVNGSQSRSFTAADVGVRSQVASLLVAGLIIVTLLLLTPIFAPLPKAALAGVIIVVAAGLLDPAAFRRLARLDRAEAGLAVIAAVIVVTIGMLAGVIVVIVLSLLLVAQRAATPRTAVLAEGPTGRFRPTKEADTTSGSLAVYRFDAPLFFANAQQFSDEILALTEDREPPLRWIIVSGEAVTGLDSTAEEMLRDLVTQLAARDVTLLFARTRAPFRHALERSGLTDVLGPNHLYPTIRAAVDAIAALERDRPDVASAERQPRDSAVSGSNDG